MVQTQNRSFLFPAEYILVKAILLLWSKEWSIFSCNRQKKQHIWGNNSYLKSSLCLTQMEWLEETIEVICLELTWIEDGINHLRSFIQPYITRSRFWNLTWITKSSCFVTCMDTAEKETSLCMAVRHHRQILIITRIIISSEWYPICLGREANSSNLMIANSQMKRRRNQRLG